MRATPRLRVKVKITVKIAVCMCLRLATYGEFACEFDYDSQEWSCSDTNLPRRGRLTRHPSCTTQPCTPWPGSCPWRPSPTSLSSQSTSASSSPSQKRRRSNIDQSQNSPIRSLKRRRSNKALSCVSYSLKRVSESITVCTSLSRLPVPRPSHTANLTVILYVDLRECVCFCNFT